MINTLVLLLAALTVGTITLMLMETAPIRPEVASLIAIRTGDHDPTEIIRQTDLPLQLLKWRNIVILTDSSSAEVDRYCHFVIKNASGSRQPTIRSTNLWKQQNHGRVITGPNAMFNASTIAVVLRSDYSGRGQTSPSGQLRKLTSLVRSLQLTFQISRSHVYLHRDLDIQSRSPGDAFPAEEFHSGLLKPTR